MLLRPNPSSGVPIYLQLMAQVKHALETGALRAGQSIVTDAVDRLRAHGLADEIRRLFEAELAGLRKAGVHDE